jgi:hypothetical protein
MASCHSTSSSHASNGALSRRQSSSSAAHAASNAAAILSPSSARSAAICASTSSALARVLTRGAGAVGSVWRVACAALHAAAAQAAAGCVGADERGVPERAEGVEMGVLGGIVEPPRVSSSKFDLQAASPATLALSSMLRFSPALSRSTSRSVSLIFL